jgi:predicted transcriptional regulator of viral defense system
MLGNRSGIEREGRNSIDKLHQSMPGPFDAVQASAVLSIPVSETRKFLSRMARQGWLARVRRGLYTVVPLGATVPQDWRDDPWKVASRLYSPCFITGWSACEHWGLTEQVFGDIVVFTSRAIRQRSQVIQSTTFRLKKVPPDLLFGTVPVWRDGVKVLVADPSRAVIDILDDPSIGGGIKHVAEVVQTYFEDKRDDSRLLDYAARIGNRSIYKRLGFLIETLSIDAKDLEQDCLRRQSTGLVLFDPSGHPGGPILKRWNLRVNVQVRGDVRA